MLTIELPASRSSHLPLVVGKRSFGALRVCSVYLPVMQGCDSWLAWVFHSWPLELTPPRVLTSSFSFCGLHGLIFPPLFTSPPRIGGGGFVVVFTLLLKFRHVFSPHVGFFSLFLGVLYFGYLFLNLNEVFMVSPSLIPVGYL